MLQVKFYLSKPKARQLRNYREPGSTCVSESPRLCAGEQSLSPESPGWTLHKNTQSLPLPPWILNFLNLGECCWELKWLAFEAKCKLNPKKTKVFNTWFSVSVHTTLPQISADMTEDGYLVLKSPVKDNMNLQCHISPKMHYLLKFPSSSDFPPSADCTHLLRCGPLSTHSKCSTTPISNPLVLFFHSLGLLCSMELCAVYFGDN